MKIPTLFLTLGLCLGGIAPALAEIGVPHKEVWNDRLVGGDRAIETGTAASLLPTSEDGTMTVNMCAKCKSERLQVNGRTRYFAGRTPVTFAEFKSLVVPGHPIAMTVFVDLKDPVVLRVVLDATPPSRSKTR